MEEGKNEEESLGPEHVEANLANDYVDELGSTLAHFKSARKKQRNVQKVGTFQAGM